MVKNDKSYGEFGEVQNPSKAKKYRISNLIYIKLVSP